MSDFIAAQCYA